MSGGSRSCGNWVWPLVSIVLLFILLQLLMYPWGSPRIKDKAKEAEVKQNLHAIQLALERYSVDSGNDCYPPFLMGGDWTDSYSVWESWVAQNKLSLDDCSRFSGFMTWEPAASDVGDALLMEGYMPEYPPSPFRKHNNSSMMLDLPHVGCTPDGNPVLLRFVGGNNSQLMYEVFGPARFAPEQSIQGDYFVHHIFNDPLYDSLGDPRKELGVDWTNPSGNSRLVGNFSYCPKPLADQLPWYATGEDGGIGSRPVAGYSLAGYGGIRTPGQDVYNRNGNYKGRFRTEACDTDCDTAKELFADDIPCICVKSETTVPGPDVNNGGSDTLRDGVILTLDSGV